MKFLPGGTCGCGCQIVVCLQFSHFVLTLSETMNCCEEANFSSSLYLFTGERTLGTQCYTSSDALSSDALSSCGMVVTRAFSAHRSVRNFIYSMHTPKNVCPRIFSSRSFGVLWSLMKSIRTYLGKMFITVALLPLLHVLKCSGYAR